MGFIDSMVSLIALGAGMYVTVYYVLPALQQMSFAPYYQQAAAQPYTAPTPIDDTGLVSGGEDELTADEEAAPLADEETPAAEGEEVIPEEAVPTAEDLGLSEEPPAEEKSKKKKSSNEKEADRRKKAEEDLKKSHAAAQKRKDKFDKDTDPKKDTRYKGKSSKEAGRAAAKALGLQTYIYPEISRPYKMRNNGVRYIYVDNYGRYWEY